MIPKYLLSCVCCLAACASAAPVFEQQVLGTELSTKDAKPVRHLSGRFLHITGTFQAFELPHFLTPTTNPLADYAQDFHLDPHYKPGSSDDDECHRGKGSAGPLGAEGSDCDSPRHLIDETFRWIETNLKDKIDFVVWTGDSARHDSDEKIPRTIDEIAQLNDVLAGKFIEIFEDDRADRGLSIPVVPTIGNNDIMPHNIFKDGPNRWTKKFADIWEKFIPEHERHTFVEGGWFTADVIPNKLAVISLNTMYFYESNSAVDGCAEKSEPGFEHMEWLRVQLELLRGRQMKAILIGHVPPARAGSKRNWDETCWQKYTLWLHRFRDVVVGSIYGHMNIDHFMLQDSHKVKILESSGFGAFAETDDSSEHFIVQSRSSYLSSLRNNWSKMPTPPDDMLSSQLSFDDWFSEDELTSEDFGGDFDQASGKKRRRFLKKIGGPYAERYSVSIVSPSIVPNYFPTLRVIEYNITGLEDATTWADTSYETVSPSYDRSEVSLSDGTEKPNKNKKKKKKQPHFTVPDHPSPASPPGPAYSNQPLTWLSYAQYYANLTQIYDEMNKLGDFVLRRESEVNRGDFTELFQLEYDTAEDKIYKMKDLTVRSYFKLATRIADKDPHKNDISVSDNEEEEDVGVDGREFASRDGGIPGIEKKKRHKNHIWRTFLERAFVGSLTDDELDDIQG